MSTLTGASVNGWLLYRAAALRDLGSNTAGCNPKAVNLYLGEQWNHLSEKERRVWRRRAALVRTNLAARAASTRAFRRAGTKASGAPRRVEVERDDVDSEMHPPDHEGDASQASHD
ncbi:hypothetical protein K523DRAFT_320966 [Schizophyllum commune Tattone D]|nr:hypothetical protein K523DRAFT_320966 [Schizophyllum commune Tattone D]